MDPDPSDRRVREDDVFQLFRVGKHRDFCVATRLQAFCYGLVREDDVGR